MAYKWPRVTLAIARPSERQLDFSLDGVPETGRRPTATGAATFDSFSASASCYAFVLFFHRYRCRRANPNEANPNLCTTSMRLVAYLRSHPSCVAVADAGLVRR